MPPLHGRYDLESDGRYVYHAYTPSPLQAINTLEIDSELSSLLIRAHRQLGKLDGMFCYIPDLNILSYPLAHHEATFSCELEIQEALYNERFHAEPIKTDANKIIADYSASLLSYKKTPPTQESTLLNTIRSTHWQMFSGEYDDAGKFRTTQLFSYPKASTQNGSPIYNPPHPNEMLTTIEALSDYINTPSEFDSLVKIALVYYQLATIRPFLIGNGLTERICVNFLLVDMGLLPRPCLCLSEYLLVADAEYRDALRLVRDSFRGYEVWIKFFLKALIIAAEKTIKMLDEIYMLRKSDYAKLCSYEKSSPLLLAFYEHLWKSPVIEARDMTLVLNVSYNTVAKAIDTLRSLDILKQADKKTRYRRFSYRKLLSTLEEQQRVTEAYTNVIE